MADLMKIQGFKELAAAMRQLPERVAKNALRAAVNAGASEIRKEARARVPVDSGLTKKSIHQRQIREKSSASRQVVYVGVRSGGRNKDGTKRAAPWYWRFVEYGTSKMAARPFMRPAFEAKKLAAVKAIGVKLNERIQLEAQRLAKK